MQFELPSECINPGFYTPNEYHFTSVPVGESITVRPSYFVGEGTVSVNWGDNTASENLVGTDPAYTKSYSYPGNYNGPVALTIREDCVFSQYFTVDVADDSSEDYLVYILLILLLAAIVVRIEYRNRVIKKI